MSDIVLWLLVVSITAALPSAIILATLPGVWVADRLLDAVEVVVRA